MYLFIIIYDFTPIKIKHTPRNIHNNFTKELSSMIPKRPIVVVKIKITGPTMASELFTMSAFSMVLNRIIKYAANISIHPDRILNDAIPNTAFSIRLIMSSSLKFLLIQHYMFLYLIEGQVFWEVFRISKVHEGRLTG
jgi:hypothetical protein